MRAFIASGAEVLSSTEIRAYTHARMLWRGQNSRYDRQKYSRAIRIAADELCERVGRSPTGSGRAILWRLRPDPEA